MFCRFAGHSHWATIKHDKSDKDIKKSSLFAKLSKSISCAVQLGGPDPCKLYEWKNNA